MGHALLVLPQEVKVKPVKSKQKKIHARKQRVKVFREDNPIFSVLIWGIEFSVGLRGALFLPVSCPGLSLRPRAWFVSLHR